MTFHTFGNRGNESLLLIPGLGVSYEIFLPLTELLKDKYYIVPHCIRYDSEVLFASLFLFPRCSWAYHGSPYGVPHLSCSFSKVLFASLFLFPRCSWAYHGSPYGVAVGIDGFQLGEKSQFTSVDDQAVEATYYVQENLNGHLDVAYGLSLGGKILSRIMERNEIVVDHAMMDAAPLLPLPRWSVNPLRYYQSLNVWTCYHWTSFWKRVFLTAFDMIQRCSVPLTGFHSHYFDVLLDECRKVWPSGKGKAVRDGYKDVYTHKLESIQGADIHYWYGTKEAFVAKPQARHLLKLCPDAHIEVFPGMNHGQLLVDHPEEIANRILSHERECIK